MSRPQLCRHQLYILITIQTKLGKKNDIQITDVKVLLKNKLLVIKFGEIRIEETKYTFHQLILSL